MSVILGQQIERASLLIQLIDDFQAVQRQPGGDDLNHIGLFGEEFGQAASADDLHGRAKRDAEAGDEALDQADVAKQQTGLHGVNRVLANG